MLNLHTYIDPNSGFCFGVVNAIKKAEAELALNRKLYCVGQIVHNEEEVLRLSEKGMQTIDVTDLEKLKEQLILFRAHGEPPESYEKSLKNKNIVVDATCPVVLKLQNKIKEAFVRKECVLIFGKRNHPEVIGLAGQTQNTAVIFENFEELKLDKLPKKVSLFSQTTKNLQQYHEINKKLLAMDFEVKFHDSICRQVSNREKDLSRFCEKMDVIVFVAGKKSSNGKVLYSICRQANEKSYHISTSDELEEKWFSQEDKVGICGATSTPGWLMEKVKKILDKW